VFGNLVTKKAPPMEGLDWNYLLTPFKLSHKQAPQVKPKDKKQLKPLR
jgi:hypothetical protein